jgi:glycosyltransferase involved in cell wall biosynthesis
VRSGIVRAEWVVTNEPDALSGESAAADARSKKGDMARPARVAPMKPRVFVNAGGSVSGGGKVYLLGLVDELARRGDRGLDWQFLVSERVIDLMGEELTSQIRVKPQPIASASARILWEQTVLPLVREVRQADVLVSALNFGPLVRRDRHILLAHNVLHFLPAETRGRKGLRAAVQARLGRLSAKRATVTVTGTRTMANAVAARTGRHVVSIPFGPGLVCGRKEPLGDRFTFIDRNSWRPHKRFAVLLRAVRELARTHHGRFVVRSACDPTTSFARGFRESEADRRLLSDPTIASHVEIEQFDPHLCDELEGDAVVVASTTESFCFPLAEAIEAELPVVVADSPLAREVCGEGAIYVRSGNPIAFAEGMRRLIEGERRPPYSPEIHQMISWATHADRLAELCHAVARS